MPKIGRDVREIIEDTQEMVIATICESKNPVPSVRNDILEMISNCENNKLEHLGKPGKIVKKFSNQINLKHPDVSEIANFPQWDEFSKDIWAAIVGNSQMDFNNYKEIVRKFMCPKPRFVSDCRERDNYRGIKNKPRNISLKSLYVLGENGFYGRPDNFQAYARNSDMNLQELKKLQNSQETFSKCKMPEVSNAVKKRMKFLDSIKEEQYLGFHRLKPTDAAMILARMHRLQWHESLFLTVPINHFDNSYWAESAEKKPELREEYKKIIGKKVVNDAFNFHYQPRLYPISHFMDMPKSVRDIVNSVESFPELNGNPAFDYYWVVMPSININHHLLKQKDTWKFYVKNELKSFADEWQANMAMDAILVADNYFVPVVLGEKDGKCYFLCLWR